MNKGGSYTCTEGGELIKTPEPPDPSTLETKPEAAKAASVVSGSSKFTRQVKPDASDDSMN